MKEQDTEVKSQNTKSPLAKAREKYFDRTSEGVVACEGKTEGKYLRNRLESAFIAGWDACEKENSKS